MVEREPKQPTSFNSTVVPFSFKEQQDPKDPSRFDEQRQESALRRGMRSSLAQKTLRMKVRRKKKRCEVFILKSKTKEGEKRGMKRKLLKMNEDGNG